MPLRTFTLNSQEFYEAVRTPDDEPWIRNGALSREPKTSEPVRLNGVNRSVIRAFGEDGNPVL